MNAKLTILALLTAALVPSTAGAVTQCTFGDVANGCVTVDGYTFGQGCGNGLAANYASAWAAVGNQSESAYAETYCFAQTTNSTGNGTGNETSTYSYNHVQAFVGGGPLAPHAVWFAWYQYDFVDGNGTSSGECRTFLYAGGTQVLYANCPLGVPPPRVGQVLP